MRVLAGLESMPIADDFRWYVLRDLKRANAALPACRMLAELRMEVFTPMKERITFIGGRRVRREIPFLPDLLFVRATREQLDPIVLATPTLQYRFVRGGSYCEAMTVDNSDMERFIHAVRSSVCPHYYTPQEVNASMRGRRVRIIGGVLDGYEGELLNAQGARVRRLLVEIPNLLSAGIELTDCEYVML